VYYHEKSDQGKLFIGKFVFMITTVYL